MENASLSNDAWNHVTTSASTDDDLTLYLANIRYLALKFIYVIIGTVGVLDNLFVLIIFVLYIKITEKTMNILIMNQSVLDLCASFFTLFIATVEVDGTRMSPDSIYDQCVCRMWLTRVPMWDFMITSTYNILLMASERYIAVVCSIWYSNNIYIKKRLAYGAIVFIWIVVPAYTTSMGFVSTDIIKGTCVPWGAYNSYEAEKTITSSIFLISYLLPLLFAVFCYSSIVCALKRKASSTGASVVNTAGRNAIVTSLMVCCGFVACWSLNAISFFLNFAGYAIDFAGWFYHFTVVLVFTNSCINPFIYAGKYHEFQQGVRHLISKLKLHQQQSESATFV